MKIRIFDRLMLYLCAFLTFFGGVGIVLFYGLLIGYPIEGQTAAMPRVAALIAGSVIALTGVWLFFFAKRYRFSKKAFVVTHTENGDLRIAVKAIEAQVKKCVDMHEEMHLISMSISNSSRSGVTVDIRISLAGNISIPLAVATLQKQVKKYLMASSGIDVKDVRVSVDTTKGEITAASPFAVKDNGETAAENAEKIVAEQAEKLPEDEEHAAPLFAAAANGEAQAAPAAAPDADEHRAPVFDMREDAAEETAAESAAGTDLPDGNADETAEVTENE